MSLFLEALSLSHPQVIQMPLQLTVRLCLMSVSSILHSLPRAAPADAPRQPQFSAPKP